MASVQAPPAAADGVWAEKQQAEQHQVQQPGLAAPEPGMPRTDVDGVMTLANGLAPASASEGSGTSATTVPVSSEGHVVALGKVPGPGPGMEPMAVGADTGVAPESGRPSRRAASAAQVAIAKTCAFEQAGGGGDMSPPQRAEQAAALQVLKEASGRGGAADAAQPLLPAADVAATVTAFAPAGSNADQQDPAGNGDKSPTKKRRRVVEGKLSAAGHTSAAAAAAAAAGTPAGLPAQQQPGQAPSHSVDLEPILALARAADSQDELRNKLVEKYPPSRGRAAVNTAFRDLFTALCPGQLFHNRASALPHMSHRLFELVGKAVGKPPAPYKPRGPRSPAGAPSAAPAGTPGAGGDSAAQEATPAAAAAAAQQPQAAHPAAAAYTAPAASAGMSGGGAAASAGGSACGHPSGPAAAAAARAAATASGELPAGSDLEPKAAMAYITANYPAELIRVAALVRRTLGMQRGSVVHLRMMLKTLHLANQDVRFQTKAGKVLNKGKLSDGGGILCYCRHCNGKEVSASEFEEHSGSKDRRPADGIFLESCNRSLKELLTLINSKEMEACTGMVDLHMEACYHCNLGGELLCCDGCNCAFHLECVNLDALPQGDWFCPLCVAAGITSKPEPMPLQPKQLVALKPPKTSVKGRLSSTGKPSKRGEGRADSHYSAPPPSKRPGGGAATGRVHMAAPAAPRAPRLGRPGARSNKNKRLFEGEEGALVNGQKLYYRTTQGETLLEGTAVVERGGPSGILCGCCSTLISASGFEAHAGRGQRRAPYDNIFTEDGMTLKAMAALLPDVEEEAAPARQDGDYGLEDVADDAREVISELDTLAGGCVLCHEVDFQRGGFGPRTIMLCDQCEREFHVGCLKKCGKCDLDAVPEGEWYCSEECERIRSLVNTSVQSQQMEIPGHPNHTWQLMRGKDGRSATAWALRTAQEILQESFDPIMDLASNTDLLPVMLYARRAGEWDYSNCLTLLLRHKGKPVVAAICRIFGPQMAELPLIATRNSARRQGHARILVNCFEDLLKNAGVHTLVLPAAHETVETWKNGFRFVDMPEDDMKLAKQQLRILIFPGTEVLWKHFPEVPRPQGHHVLVPPPERPSAEEAADGTEVAAIMANMVACVAAACGEPVLPECLGMTAPEVAAARQHAPAAPAPAAPQAPQHTAAAQQPVLAQQQPPLHQQPQPQQIGAAPPPAAAHAAAPPAAPPADEYEAMIAQAMAAADQEVLGQRGGGAPAWATGQPPWAAAQPMDIDRACAAAGFGALQQSQPQHLARDDSDVTISEDDDDMAAAGDADSGATAAKRARQA